MNICPLTKGECGGSDCPLWVRLTDYQGCPFDLADKALQNFKRDVLLPAARTVDQIVKEYREEQRRRQDKK